MGMMKMEQVKCKCKCKCKSSAGQVSQGSVVVEGGEDRGRGTGGLKG